MPVVTLTKDNSVLQDAQIYKTAPTSNYGSNTTAQIGLGATLNDIFRSLFKFDLGLIPNNAVINSATLKLYFGSTSASSRRVDVHRITGTDWQESTVKWDTNVGYDASSVSSVASTAANSYADFDVKSIVQSWVDGTSPNYGFLAKDGLENTVSTQRAISSKEAGSGWPQLVIDYTIPTTGKKQVEYVGIGGAVEGGSVTSIQVPLPTGAAAGDLLVAQLAVGQVPNDLAGWTKYYAGTGSATTIFYKFMTIGETAPIFTFPGASLALGRMTAFRNVKSVLSLNSSAFGSAVSSIYPPQYNATIDDTLFFIMNSVNNNGTALTPPLSYQEGYDFPAGSFGRAMESSYHYMHTNRTQTTAQMTTTLGAAASATSALMVLEPIVNNPPTLTLSSPADNLLLSEGSSVLLGSTNDFVLRITPNDSDASDTLEYTVLLRGVTKQPYTSCAKGVAFDYTIPYSDLLLGNNAVQVTVRDNNGGQVTINFTLRNKAPSTISQQSVLQVLTALGYPNTSATCLNDLKPSDYGITTLSLSEILNSLD